MIGHTFHLFGAQVIDSGAFVYTRPHKLRAVCSLRANFPLYELFPFAKLSIYKKGGKGKLIFVLGVFAL